MPQVSVLLGSSRPGGLDISLLGLCAQTYDDFEVIFVDARYHKRHELVLDAVKASGLKQPFYHVPNHRYGEEPWGATCAGLNTGFMLSAGTLLLMLCDYAYAPPGWIEAHLSAHADRVEGAKGRGAWRERGGRRMVVAPHCYRQMPPFSPTHGIQSFVAGASLDEVVAQREKFAEVVDPADTMTAEQIYALPVESANDPKLSMPEGNVDHTYMHTKNESLPRDIVLRIGGMDENYDRGRGPGDHDFGRRLIGAGLFGWLVPGARVEVVNPRHVMPNPNIAIGDGPYPGRWSVPEGNAYYVATETFKGANNPFDLSERRQELWHWRAMSQRREAVIEKNVIPDAEYFARCPFRY